MSLKLFICKLITLQIKRKERQILRFQKIVFQLKRWIRQDRQKLQARFMNLSFEDALKYGLWGGYIDSEDSKEIAKMRKERERNR